MTTVAAYTLAGGTASLIVGAALGSAGGIWLPGSAGEVPALVVMIVVAAMAALHEMGWISLPIPRWNRQTNVMWGRTFGIATAAILWGVDLGLIITTRTSFAGTWSVLLLAAASRRASVGGLLLLLYWLGRAGQVWIATLFVRDANDVRHLLRDVHQQYSALQRIHVVGLVWVIAVLGFLVLEGKLL